VRNYGKAPSTRQAVLCFFDGNDVSDLVREVQETNSIRQTGHRLGREKQTSLLLAARDHLPRLLARSGARNERSKLTPNAVLITGDRKYPAAIWPIPPPRWEDLKSEKR